MPKDENRCDALLRGRSQPEQALIEAFAAGRVGRRAFLRHGAALGLSLRFLGSVSVALGLVELPRSARAASPGGTLRIGQLVPQTAIEPMRIADAAGIGQLSAVGEYLCLNAADFVLRPMLAESWSPNADGTVWSFKIRKGVKFHDGRAMSAADVTATFERLSDPDSGANALTLFSGYLAKGGTRQKDGDTVEFHLDAPHGNFPYLVSSDNYDAVILPADYRDGFDTNFTATGPFKLEKYTARDGSSFVRNDDYWGPRAIADRLEYSFFVDYPAQIEALRASQIDIVQQLPFRFSGGSPADANFEFLTVPSASHHQIHMRTDMAPFTDPRVRRALALAIDRPALVQTLTAGHARIGNDNPFAANYPFTDKSVPQRVQNIGEAKQLLEAAGVKPGTKVALTVEKFVEVPDLAIAVQDAAKDIGIHIDIELLDQGAYYGEGVFGKSPWLDSMMGITDFAHRGLPSASLTASLRGDGAWNAAHYRNPAYDELVSSFIAALNIDAQRQAAGRIEKQLLDDTPVLIAYFHDLLVPVRKGVTGVEATAMGHLLLGQSVPIK